MIGKNVELFVAEAVQSALDQSFTDIEVVFVDDASSDRTSEIVRSFSDPRVRYERSGAPIGISAARNRALELARGEFVACLDSDDLTETTRVERQLRTFDQYPTLGLVRGDVRLIDVHGADLGVRRSGTTSPGAALRQLRWKCPFVHSTVMYRAAVARDVGGYDVAARFGEDYGLWLRIGARFDVVNLDAILSSYRLHPDQSSNTKKSFDRESLASLRRSRLALAAARSESLIAARGRDDIHRAVQASRNIRIAAA